MAAGYWRRQTNASARWRVTWRRPTNHSRANSNSTLPLSIRYLGLNVPSELTTVEPNSLPETGTVVHLNSQYFETFEKWNFLVIFRWVSQILLEKAEVPECYSLFGTNFCGLLNFRLINLLKQLFVVLPGLPCYRPAVVVTPCVISAEHYCVLG